MEERKKKEVEWSNFRRSEEVLNNPEKYKRYCSNKKFYSVVRKIHDFQKDWLKKRCQAKDVLVIGCGEGAESLFLAEHGARVTGIDISEESINKARKLAQEAGLGQNAKFVFMDAENLTFPDNSFDIVTCSGVLHHLDIEKTYSEIARVIKPEGAIICIEPLAYNPLIMLYRKLTPHLRTEWEAGHIISMKSINLAKKHFGLIEKRFYFLATITAVPFRKIRYFNFILPVFEAVDSVLLKIPFIRLWAWQVLFILSKPKKLILKK